VLIMAETTEETRPSTSPTGVASGLASDRRRQYDASAAGNGNFAWAQHIVHHLAPAGVAGFVLGMARCRPTTQNL